MITALVNYYDEDPFVLREMVQALHSLGVSWVVAIDGPYALYPAVNPIHSTTQQSLAIHDTCRRLGMSWIITRKNCWSGNEIEKRQFGLDQGLTISGLEDWLLIWDADFATNDPIHLLDHLPQTKPFGDFMIHEDPQTWRNRPLLLAQPGMHYVDNHHTIVCPDGTRVSTGKVNPGDAQELGELLPMTIEHARLQKSALRRENQQKYYDKRDRLGAEK